MSADHGTLAARTIKLTGIVQGVGMRPTVYRHADAAGIGGWVLNGVGGVTIHAVGTPEQLDDFEKRLQEGYPVQARVETYESWPAEVEPDDKVGAFGITKSDGGDGSAVFVSPDVATCPNCVRELFDPHNRRYRYPFINCTDCGPRFTVIADLPYDRPKTSMAAFPMCPECDFEYHDPKDRRFDAQPDACFMCGPQLEWVGDDDTHLTVTAACLDERRSQSDAIFSQTVAALEAGKIVAIKGLGGFHLACDAANEQAVQTLRARKHRSGKAFAIMAPTLESVQAFAHVNDQEAALLTGTVRPIVLLRRANDANGALPGIAPSVAGALPEIGVMLPYTPLHHILLHDFGRPLVMTSGNISDESIVKDNDDARERLTAIADCLLLHNRDILARYDDSVVRVIDGTMRMVRRARGMAPDPVKIPPSLRGTQDAPAPCVLACGPEQKHTFTITRNDSAFVSQHLGDLEDARTSAAFHEALATYQHIFRLTPAHLAADLHPEYLSTKFARAHAEKIGAPLDFVQHHHAHIVAVTGEYDVPQRVVGLALDGTGLGDDGTLWGGEVLTCDWRTYTRAAHLSYLKLPGGKSAIKNPDRIAYAYLYERGLLDHPGARALVARFVKQGEADKTGQADGALLQKMVDKGLNTPVSSSLGRLFDMLAALTGVCTTATYEGEPAILLEACAHALSAEQVAHEEARGEWKRLALAATEHDGMRELEIHGLIGEVLDGLARSEEVARLAWRIHRALAQGFADEALYQAKREGLTTVALGGGCFMNRLLLEQVTRALEDAGLTVLVSQKLPQNDGCISYGQAIATLARIAAGDEA